MKFLKVLIIPAVVLLSVVVATPAFAHDVVRAKVTQTCENGQICVKLEGDTVSGTAKRIVKLQLFSDGTNVGETMLTVPAFDQTNPHFTAKACFPAVTNGNTTKFTVVVANVVDKDNKDSDLTVKDEHGRIIFQFDDEHRDSVVLFEDVQPCIAPTPTPTATPTPTPTATPTATPAAAALASTGGFDFRFPLVGLTVLVGGLALLLVSLSRGRSPSK